MIKILTEAGQGNNESKPLSVAGNIPEFGLQEVLQLAQLYRRNGWVEAKNHEHTIQFLVWNAEVVQARWPKGLMFGEYLVQNQVVRPDVLSNVLTLQKQFYRPLGSILCEEGLVPEEKLKSNLARFFCECAVQVMRWHDGAISFREMKHDEISEDLELTRGCRMDWLLLESTHKLDQWQRITQDEKRLESTLKINREYLNEGQTVKLGRRAWRILALVNGRRNISKILGKLPDDPFQNMKTIDQMVQASMLFESNFSQLDLIVPGKVPMDRRSNQAFFPGQFEANILYREMDGKRHVVALAKECKLNPQQVWEYLKLLVKGGVAEIVSGQREYENLFEEGVI